MLVQLSDPAAILDLSDFLRSRINAVVEQCSTNELEVSLLGSYSNAAMEEEILAAVREWESGKDTGGDVVDLASRR